MFLTEKQVLQLSSSVISSGCYNIVLCSSWWGSAAGAVWLGGLSRSAGVSSAEAHLEWEFVGLSLWDQRAAGHAPLGSFLIQSQEQEDLHLGVDLAHCFRRAPTELEEFPQFLGNVKDRILLPSPPNCTDSKVGGVTLSWEGWRVAETSLSLDSNESHYTFERELKIFISHLCHSFG